MVESLKYGLVGKDLNSSAELTFDATILIAKSAKKNIKHGQTLGDLLFPLINQISILVFSDDNQDLSFAIYHRAALLKQLVQNIYHGSVIGAILEKNNDITKAAVIIESIIDAVGITQKGSYLDAIKSFKVLAD